MISETEIDDTFPEPQLFGKRYSKPLRLARTLMEEGYFSMQENITCQMIKTWVNTNFEGFLVEINLRCIKLVTSSLL